MSETGGGVFYENFVDIRLEVMRHLLLVRMTLGKSKECYKILMKKEMRHFIKIT